MMKYWLSVNWRNWNVMKVTLAMFYNLYSAEALFRAGLGLSWVSVTILTLTVSLNALFRASLLSVVHWWLVGGIVSDMWECICPRCGFSNSFNRFCLLVNQIWLILSLLVLFFWGTHWYDPFEAFSEPIANGFTLEAIAQVPGEIRPTSLPISVSATGKSVHWPCAVFQALSIGSAR